MNILGINSNLNASAVLMQDNRVVFGIQEERISKIKNQPGFPHLSIKAALDFAGLSLKDIDHVFVGDLASKVEQSREADLNKFVNRYKSIKEEWFGSEEPVFSKVADLSRKALTRLREGQAREKLLEDYLREIGLLEKHQRFDHHLCHAASAYYGLARHKEDKYLVFSMDGGGDGRTSAVFIGENGQLKEIASSDSFSPACIYAHITFIMGFMPHEHEYKLMGLAPYASSKYSRTIKESLSQFVGFSKDNPLVLTNTEKYPGVRNTGGDEKQTLIKELFKVTLNQRFDNLSGGLQMLAEETAVKWIKAGIASTGIRRILLSGGFFMNVKANKLISELPEVESVCVFPSCGDETNAFGAAFLGCQKVRGAGVPDVEFGNFCVGPTGGSDIQAAMDKFNGKVLFEKITDINAKVAELLVQKRIVARCSGQMEFGARALGNRSILASPDDVRIINKINAAIKKRDFWMPFAPAVLEDKADMIMSVPASLKEYMSPYMMFTFESKKEMADKIVAGIHQFDKTTRAQTVNRELYPDFYEIISHFYKRTGIPAVLNTSFNLHGFPIVLGACDAVEVFLNSDLDMLVVENYLIRKA